MSRGLVRAAVAAALLLLAGCASADPVVPLGAAPVEAVDTTGPVETLTTLLTEVYAHQLGAAEETAIVSDGATVAVAVTELAAALDLGDGARDFAAATAFEIGTGDVAPVQQVEVTTAGPAVVGSHEGMTIATVGAVLSITPVSGAVTQTRVTYALTIDGERLVDVGAWGPGLDSGVGLASPLGAAQRFLDLVHSGETEAATYFSDGVNTEAQLQVLLAATGGEVRLAEVPQAQMGAAHVVYALDPSGQVLARFDVLLGSPVRVVYTPTA